MAIQTPITLQIDVFCSVPPILTTMQTLMSASSTAQRITFTQIQMAECAHPDVPTGLTINMRTQEQAAALKIVQKIPGEIIRQTSVSQPVLLVPLLKIQQENVSLSVLKAKNSTQIRFCMYVRPSVREDTLAAKSTKLAYQFVIWDTGETLQLLFAHLYVL